MDRSWTFSQKIAAGFAAVVTLAVISSAGAIHGLRMVVASKDQVIEVNASDLIDAEKLRVCVEREGGALRGFLLTRDEQFLAARTAAQADYEAVMHGLRAHATPAEERLLKDIVAAAEPYRATFTKAIALRRTDTATAEAVARTFDDEVLPRRQALDRAVAAYVDLVQGQLTASVAAATAAADATALMVGGAALVAVVLAGAIALLLTRTLSRQIGSAVQHVQSSASELQAAANQQATGAKEQAAAMAEITTTISELLATSKQIAESAQRVTGIAGETAGAAHSGEQLVARTGNGLDGIKRQVDVIVAHMLELGRKSQQIGGITEIINELSEQTNILAINATIEAAGAGDPGRRFGVVADEIRKLADRVGGSTKEIRTLIDEIRAAVNSTVMATESGTKAVDAGVRQFGEVTATLGQIAGGVGTTTEAAREIELSTKQQATAIEQVNLAVGSAAQATREAEASSGQILQTAGQLSTLSGDLLRLIRPRREG